MRGGFSRELPGAAEQIVQRAASLAGPHRLRVTAVPGRGSLRLEMTLCPRAPSALAFPAEPCPLSWWWCPAGGGARSGRTARLDAAPGRVPACEPPPATATPRCRRWWPTCSWCAAARHHPARDGRILPG
ncbi:hypothetical protein QJS66_13895 [Kocuria rhizophila]|nr:hypothetical protein QJS66_13895 [Kocuria rhizophila]